MYQKTNNQNRMPNIYIKSSQVILYDKDNKLIGTVSAGKAKFIASDRGLTLFPINADSNPAIYKLSDGSDKEPSAHSNGNVPDNADVRLLDEQHEQIGIVKGSEARKIASDKGLDLIIVAEQATPIVCMIGNLSKYLYDQKKKQKANEKKTRASAKAAEVKEIKLPSVVSGSSSSDMTRLVKQGSDFLAAGHPVKFTVKFSGHQAVHAKDELKNIEQFIKEHVSTGTMSKVSDPESRGYSSIYSIFYTPSKKK